jgi:hypothetical protein
MIQLTKSRDRQTDRMWIFTTKTLLQNLQQTRNLEIVFARSFLQILWQNSCRKFSCENSCRKLSCENSRRKFKCKNSCREFSCENSCRKFICDDSCSRAMKRCPLSLPNVSWSLCEFHARARTRVSRVYDCNMKQQGFVVCLERGYNYFIWTITNWECNIVANYNPDKLRLSIIHNPWLEGCT